MKRGEKILILIGGAWTGLFGVLYADFYLRYGHVPSDSIIFVVLLLAVWTLIGVLWLLIYGRSELRKK